MSDDSVSLRRTDGSVPRLLSSSSGLAATAFKRFSADSPTMRHSAAKLSGRHRWCVASLAAILALALPLGPWHHAPSSVTKSELAPSARRAVDAGLRPFDAFEVSQRRAIATFGPFGRGRLAFRRMSRARREDRHSRFGVSWIPRLPRQGASRSAQGAIVPGGRQSGGEGQPARHPVRRSDSRPRSGRRVVSRELGAR